MRINDLPYYYKWHGQAYLLEIDVEVNETGDIEIKAWAGPTYVLWDFKEHLEDLRQKEAVIKNLKTKIQYEKSKATEHNAAA